MLFMPISAEAVSAALASDSDRPLLKASIRTGLRAAKAADRAAPTASSGGRVERAMTPSRFRRMSLAQSGSCSSMAERNSIVFTYNLDQEKPGRAGLRNYSVAPPTVRLQGHSS